MVEYGMKQRITVEQAEELGVAGWKRLNKWLLKRKYIERWELKLLKELSNNKGNQWSTLLNIGAMIEFLDERASYLIFGNGKYMNNEVKWRVKFGGRSSTNDPEPELCDALWEAVKEVLNEKTIKKSLNQKAV